jgi:elongation factor 1-beta
VYKAVGKSDVSRFPSIARWSRHIATFIPEASELPGDPAKAYTSYGPDASILPSHPKAAAAAEEDDDDIDLFGSDDEEEDAEAARIRDERLAEYKSVPPFQGYPYD